MNIFAIRDKISNQPERSRRHPTWHGRKGALRLWTRIVTIYHLTWRRRKPANWSSAGRRYSKDTNSLASTCAGLSPARSRTGSAGRRQRGSATWTLPTPAGRLGRGIRGCSTGSDARRQRCWRMRCSTKSPTLTLRIGPPPDPKLGPCEWRKAVH